MSQAFTSAGTTLKISSALPATFDAAGYTAVTTWVEVGEITDMGEFGREYNLVSHNPIGDRRTVKRKGSYNDGTMSLQLARVPSDLGQAKLIEARDSDNSYAIVVTLQNGTKLYTTVQVMSYTTNVGNVDQILGANVALEIDRDIVEVI